MTPGNYQARVLVIRRVYDAYWVSAGCLRNWPARCAAAFLQAQCHVRLDYPLYQSMQTLWILTWGFSKILFTPSTRWERNLALSALLNKERRTEAICTRHERTCGGNNSGENLQNKSSLASSTSHALTSGEKLGGMEWYRSKKSCSVEESRKAAETMNITWQCVGTFIICYLSNHWCLILSHQSASLWGSVLCRGRRRTHLWRCQWSQNSSSCGWVWEAA